MVHAAPCLDCAVAETLGFDPLAPENVADPYPAYARLRARGALVFWERLACVLVTRHRECLAVLRDPRRFASDPRRVGRALSAEALSVQTLDPPAHALVRNLLVQATRAQDLEALEARTRAEAEARIAGLSRARGGDLVASLVTPLALHATCAFVGVPPPPDRAAFTSASDAIVRSMDAGLDPTLAEPGRLARIELSRRVARWFAAAPRAGLIGRLAASARAAPIAPAVLDNSVRVAFHAGFTSVASALAGALHTLLRHEVDWAPLRDPARADTAVDELLRYDGPVQVTARACVEDTELGGTRLARGQTLLLLLGSANRDAAAFDDPDDLRLERAPNPHLAFGWGTHACLGAALAKVILRATLGSLARHPVRPRLSGPVEHKPQATQRGLARLPVAWDA